MKAASVLTVILLHTIGVRGATYLRSDQYQKFLMPLNWAEGKVSRLLSLHPSVEEADANGVVPSDSANISHAHGLLSSNDKRDGDAINALPPGETVPNTGVGAIASHQFALTTTLREALQFKPASKAFNEKFFESMDGRVLNPDIETQGQANILFVTLSIKRDDLDKENFIIKWSVKTGGKYVTKSGEVTTNPTAFASRLVGDEEIAENCDESKETCTYYTPQYHAADADGMKRGGDIIMVSPGTKIKGVNNPGDGQRNRQIGDYMSSWAEGWGYKATSYQEKCALWSKAGKISIERLEGKLDRRNKFRTEVGWPEGIYRLKDNVDEKGKPGEGLDEVTIYTHGLGVPWLHLRVESHPQFPVV